MGLVAAQATQVSLDLGYIRRIHDVADGVTFHRMAEPILQPQNHHSVLLEVVLGQLDLAVEDGYLMLSFQLLRRRVGPMAFETEGIAVRTQQMNDVAAMRRVARGAALRECGLMMHGFLCKIGNFTVATEADVYSVCLGEPGLPAGVGIVAIGAIAGGSRMLHFGALDEFRLIVVAGHAKRLDILLGQHHFAVFSGSVAGAASVFVSKRWMQELGHQLRSGRLVRIVAAEAIGFFKGLVLMGLLQCCIFWIVAIDAESGSRFGQMEIEFSLSDFTGLMRGVARIAAESSAAWRLPFFPGSAVPTLWHVKTEIVFFVARFAFSITGSCCWKYADRGKSGSREPPAGAHGLDLGGVLVAWQLRHTLYGTAVISVTWVTSLVGPDLMAAQATHRDGGMNELALRLVFVAFEALRPVDVLIQRNGVNRGGGARNHESDQHKQNQNHNKKRAVALTRDLIAATDAMGDQSHTASDRVGMHDSNRISHKPG
jgi:hypothetical protein